MDRAFLRGKCASIKPTNKTTGREGSVVGRDRKENELNRLKKQNEDLKNQLGLADKMLKQRESELDEWRRKAEELADQYSTQVQNLQNEMEKRIKLRIVNFFIFCPILIIG